MSKTVKKAIKKHPEALKDRDWRAVKFFVHNNVRKFKKQMLQHDNAVA